MTVDFRPDFTSLPDKPKEQENFAPYVLDDEVMKAQSAGVDLEPKLYGEVDLDNLPNQPEPKEAGFLQRMVRSISYGNIESMKRGLWAMEIQRDMGEMFTEEERSQFRAGAKMTDEQKKRKDEWMETFKGKMEEKENAYMTERGYSQRMVGQMLTPLILGHLSTATLPQLGRFALTATGMMAYERFIDLSGKVPEGAPEDLKTAVELLELGALFYVASGKAYKDVKFKIKTRPATLQERAFINEKVGKQFRADLRKSGIDPARLNTKGTVLKYGEDMQVGIHGEGVKMLQGKAFRVPRGWSVKEGVKMPFETTQPAVYKTPKTATEVVAKSRGVADMEVVKNGLFALPAPTRETAIAEMLGIAKDLNLNIDKIEVVDEEIVLDPTLPEVQEILLEQGYTKEEIQNAEANGEKFIVAGQHTKPNYSESGEQRGSSLRLFRGHGSETIFHELTHALEKQGGLVGWKGTPEQHAQYMEKLYKEGGWQKVQEFTKGGRRIFVEEGGKYQATDVDQIEGEVENSIKLINRQVKGDVETTTMTAGKGTEIVAPKKKIWVNPEPYKPIAKGETPKDVFDFNKESKQIVETREEALKHMNKVAKASQKKKTKKPFPSEFKKKAELQRYIEENYTIDPTSEHIGVGESMANARDFSKAVRDMKATSVVDANGDVYITVKGLPAYKYEKAFSVDNSKVKAYILDMPPIYTCKNCVGCGTSCYAIGAEQQHPKVLAKRWANLYMWLNHRDKFIEMAKNDLKGNERTLVRVHQSGDILSQKYVEFITELVQSAPEKSFYTYTKTTDHDLSNLLAQPNFNLVSSLLPNGARNYGSQDYIDKMSAKFGIKQCPAGDNPDMHCANDDWKGKGPKCNMCATEKHMLFKEHGTPQRKTAKEAQEWSERNDWYDNVQFSVKKVKKKSPFVDQDTEGSDGAKIFMMKSLANAVAKQYGGKVVPITSGGKKPWYIVEDPNNPNLVIPNRPDLIKGYPVEFIPEDYSVKKVPDEKPTLEEYIESQYPKKTVSINELKVTDYDSLHPHEKFTEQVDDMTKTLREGGTLPPISIYENGIVVDGRHRLVAYERAGIDKVPVKIVPHRRGSEQYKEHIADLTKKYEAEYSIKKVPDVEKKMFTDLMRERIKDIKKKYKTPTARERAGIKEMQTDITNLIQSFNIPQADKAKMITAVKNTNTLSQSYEMVKKLEVRAEKYRSAQAKRDYKRQIKRELDTTKPYKVGDKRVAKFDYETNKIFDDLRAINTMNQTQASEYLQSIPEEATQVDLIKVRFAELKANGASASEELHEAVLNNIQMLKDIGKGVKDEQELMKQINREYARDEIEYALTHTPTATVNKFGQAMMNWYRQGFTNMQSMLNSLIGKDLAEKYNMEMSNAEVQTAMFKTLQKMKKTIEDITGVANGERVMVEHSTGETFPMTDRDGIVEEYSKAELMNIYLGLKNPTVKERYYNAFGEAQIKSAMAQLNENDMAIADAYMEEIQQYRAVLNERNIEVTGRDLGTVENYYPTASEYVADVYDDMRMQGETPSAMKARSAGTQLIPKKMNMYQTFARHVGQAEHIRTITRRYENLKRIFSDRKIKNIIEKKIGEGVYKELMKMIELQSLNKKVEEIDYVANLFAKAMNNWVTSKVAINTSTFIRQIGSISNYTEVMPVASWVGGFIKSVANPKSTFDYMWKNSEYLQMRFNMGYDEAVSRAINDAKKIHMNRGKWSKALSSLVRSGDITAIVFGGKPYVDWLQTKEGGGLSKEEAFKVFEQATMRAQQSNMTASLSNMQNSRSGVSRMFLPFKNTPHQYARKLFDSWIMLANGDISLQDFAKTQIIYGVIQPTIYVASGAFNKWLWIGLGTLLLQRAIEDEDNDVEYKMLREIMVQMVMGYGLNMIGGFGDVANYYARHFAGLKTYKVVNMPVVSEVEDIIRRTTKKEITMDDWMTIGGGIAGITAGAPVGVFKRYYDYLFDNRVKTREERIENARKDRAKAMKNKEKKLKERSKAIEKKRKTVARRRKK